MEMKQYRIEIETGFGSFIETTKLPYSNKYLIELEFTNSRNFIQIPFLSKKIYSIYGIISYEILESEDY